MIKSILKLKDHTDGMNDNLSNIEQINRVSYPNTILDFG